MTPEGTWLERWRRMPRPVKRLTWWWLLPLIFTPLWFVVVISQPSSPWIMWLSAHWIAPSLGFIPVFVAQGVTIASQFRTRRRFRATGGRMCTNCAHSLVGLGETGICPECGHAFNIESDRVLWHEAKIASKPGSTPP